jgi:hypothetical protein
VHLADPAPLRALAGALALVPNLALASPEATRTSEPAEVVEIVGAEPLADGETETVETEDPESETETVETEDPETEDPETEEAPISDVETVGPTTGEPATTIRPPRVDGPYVGGLLFGGASFARVLAFDLNAPLAGGGAFLQAGDAVLKWLSLGIAVGGQAGVSGNRRLAEGALLVEVAFLPSQRYPLSIRTGFGFGGGRVVDRQTGERPGFGGALFKGTLRYEFFPLAAKKRPDRGGGWAIGPELGWLGATPAAPGQPFVHTILLGVSTSLYFGS